MAFQVSSRERVFFSYCVSGRNLDDRAPQKVKEIVEEEFSNPWAAVVHFFPARSLSVLVRVVRWSVISFMGGPSQAGSGDSRQKSETGSVLQ